MTVFDVLRYPISDLPTAEELIALPADLYRKWLHYSTWSDQDALVRRLSEDERSWVAQWMTNHLLDPETQPGRGTSPETMLEIKQDIVLLH